MSLAFITGTTRGLGKALKEQFEAVGWAVEPLNRPEFDLSNLDFQKLDNRFRQTPVRDRTVFVNNAATHHINKASRTFPIEIATEVATNITAPIIAISTFLRHFPAGEVATMTSVAASEPYPHWSLYSAAKAATESYLRVLAAEGTKVHVLNPGAVDTDMQATIRDAEFPGVDQFRTMQADGRLKSPTFIAKALVWKVTRS